MSSGKGLLGKINALLIWRVLLALVLLANIAFGAMLWISGGKETEDANASGRRLFYTLADSKITGRQVTSEELAKSLKPDDEKKDPQPEIKPEEAKATEALPVEKPAEPTISETEQKAPDATVTPETPPVAVVPEENATASPEVPPAATSAAEVPPTVPPVDAPATPVESPVVEGQAVQPVDSATPPAPVVALPEQAASDEAQAAPVSPEAPVFNQAPAPLDTSATPSMLPETAPTPPLQNQSAPAIKPTSQKLPDVNPLITEKTTEGSIPVVAQDGTKAWRYYAKPFTRSGDKPMIAIIIVGLGHNKLVTEHAIALNENVTLGFSPYARDVEKWSASARLAGHEIMLDLPVEPANFPAADPGPYGLLTSKSPQENEDRLRWHMSRVPTSVGFIMPRNERYSTSAEHMKLLLQSLVNRGLMLVLSRESASDGIKEVLGNTTAANLTADFVIDEDLSEATIKAKLASIEQLATQRGFAIGIAQPYPLTISQLKAWMDTLSAKGITIVPISAVAKQDFS